MMLGLLANRQKQKPKPPLPPAAVEPPPLVICSDRLHPVYNKHETIACANETVLRHVSEYETFLDLWLQEGLTRFCTSQKCKRQ